MIKQWVWIITECYPEDPDLRLEPGEFPAVTVCKSLEVAKELCEADSKNEWEQDSLGQIPWPAIKWAKQSCGIGERNEEWRGDDPYDGACISIRRVEVRTGLK